MLKVFGFRLELRDSNIPGGGRGVFLSEDSCTIPPGKLVALYPGEIISILHGVYVTVWTNSVLRKCGIILFVCRKILLVWCTCACVCYYDLQYDDPYQCCIAHFSHTTLMIFT